MTEQEQTLLDLFNQLSEQDAHSLLRFATFLAGQETHINTPVVQESAAADSTNDEIPKPEKIERPDKERVVDALKRLSATYPMLEKQQLLNKASEMVAQHVMFGKSAVDTIDEIEALFRSAYDKFVADYNRN